MSHDAATGDIQGGAALLRELALGLRWSWNHAADDLWNQLEPELWARTHNPWVVLRTVSQQRLGQTLSAPVFRARLDRLVSLARDAVSARLLPPGHRR